MKGSIHEYAEDWKFGSKMYAIDLLQRLCNTQEITSHIQQDWSSAV
jgi:hypothetical protein